MQTGALMAEILSKMQAPGFAARDFRGKEVSLSDFAGKKNVLMVFNRGFV